MDKSEQCNRTEINKTQIELYLQEIENTLKSQGDLFMIYVYTDLIRLELNGEIENNE